MFEATASFQITLRMFLSRDLALKKVVLVSPFLWLQAIEGEKTCIKKVKNISQYLVTGHIKYTQMGNLMPEQSEMAHLHSIRSGQRYPCRPLLQTLPLTQHWSYLPIHRSLLGLCKQIPGSYSRSTESECPSDPNGSCLGIDPRGSSPSSFSLTCHASQECGPAPFCGCSCVEFSHCPMPLLSFLSVQLVDSFSFTLSSGGTSRNPLICQTWAK